MRTIGLIFKLVLGFSILFIIAVTVIIFMALQDFPLVTKNQPLTTNEISQVRKIIQRNDPSRLGNKKNQRLKITEDDLNLLLRYVSDKSDNQLRAKVILVPSIFYAQATLELNDNPVGDFINITAELEQSDNTLKIKSMNIGKFAIPSFIANALIDYGHQQLQNRYMEYQTAIQSIDNVQFQQHGLIVNYHWQPELANQFKDNLTSRLISQQQKIMFLTYHEHLAQTVNAISDTRPSLSLLFNDMFAFAQQRSLSSDPVMENRTLLISLGAYMLNKNIPELLGMNNVKNVRRKNFYLLNRNDLSKHLVISAALTAIADSSFAHAIGLDKELSDSDGGSGFSFADLAADRAGVTLATTALSSENNARVIQKRLATANSEHDYMPTIEHMPEGLQQLDFALLYRHTDSPEYKLVIDEIDQRITNCNIYR